MSAHPRFSLRAAVTDNVATGRRIGEAPPAREPETAPAVPSPTPAKTKRAATREGARGITVWVEPEIYRMLKLVGLDAGLTTQAVMMEAIDDLLAKKGKGRIMKSR